MTDPAEAVRLYVAAGDVVLALKQFPMSDHKLAMGAAESALCANAQGKFWELHDLVMNQDRLADRDLRGLATDVGLDLGKYDSCRNSGVAARLVDADRSEAVALGVFGVPTFFFGVVQADGRVHVTDVRVGIKAVEGLGMLIERSLTGAKR